MRDWLTRTAYQLAELVELHRESLATLRALKATAPTRDSVLSVEEVARQLGIGARPCKVWLIENGLLVPLGLPEICDGRRTDAQVVRWSSVLDLLDQKHERPAPVRPLTIARQRPAIRRGALHGGARRG